MKNKKYLIIGLVLIIIIAVAVFIEFPQSIASIKNEAHLGKRVRVSGIVTGVINIGELTGYEIIDKNGDKISVDADILPQKGDKVTVKGTLKQAIIVGYYIYAQ